MSALSHTRLYCSKLTLRAKYSGNSAGGLEKSTCWGQRGGERCWPYWAPTQLDWQSCCHLAEASTVCASAHQYWWTALPVLAALLWGLGESQMNRILHQSCNSIVPYKLTPQVRRHNVYPWQSHTILNPILEAYYSIDNTELSIKLMTSHCDINAQDLLWLWRRLLILLVAEELSGKTFSSYLLRASALHTGIVCCSGGACSISP